MDGELLELLAELHDRYGCSDDCCADGVDGMDHSHATCEAACYNEQRKERGWT